MDSTIDTYKIIDIITHSRKYGESFIPEIDGKAMLRELLPIQRAIIEGRDSTLYRETVIAYQIVMKDLIKRQHEMDPGGVIATPILMKGLDYYDRRIDRFPSEDIAKYEGVFGKYRKDDTIEQLTGD
jgi:hypothetical protein